MNTKVGGRWSRRVAGAAIFGGLAVAGVTLGCAEGIEVKTATAPDATAAFTNARTFHFLHVSHAIVDSNPANSSDPMIENSITGRLVHGDIERAMVRRGYTRQPQGADLSIAYYIGARNKLEVSNYDYGYPFWGWRGWRWGGAWGAIPQQQVTEYEQGTVIIDVLDSTGKRLLWRGVGKSEVPDDASQYGDALAKSVRAIMHEFPGHAAG